MTYDVSDKNLIRAKNGFAPQGYNPNTQQFELSYNSDGASHTKIVDHNGNPISSENKLQVADADVKTELEQIKQTQQQILQRLDNPIDTQLTGNSIEDGQAMPVRTIGIKSTYVDLLDNPVTVLPGMSHTTPIIDLTDCSDMTLAVRVQGSKKWRTIWQNRTKSGSGLAATHLIDRRDSAIPYDAKRESLKTPYGYAVVTNGESEEIVVESIAIVKWVVGGENNGA